MDTISLNFFLKTSLDYNHEQVKSFGLSNSECAICSYVNRNEGCSQDDVVKGLRMDKTTLAKAVQSLEKKGLLSRKTDKNDRRKKLLHTTKKCRTLCEKLVEVHSKWINEVMSVLTPEEHELFDSFCIRLSEKAKDLLQSS